MCTGYQRERIFIVNQTKHTGLATVNGSTPCAPAVSVIDASTDPNWSVSLPTWKEKIKPPKLFKPSNGISLVPAYRQRLYDAYLRASVPDADYVGPGFMSWPFQIAELPEHPPALATAILAISLHKLGRLNRDEYLVHDSLEYYTQSLWELQKALWDPKQMYRDETLAACRILGLYELVECPGGTRGGYISHQDGASRLVQLRGPEAHVDGLAHSLFRSFRAGDIMLALDRHSPGFLADKEWMEIPYSIHPKSAGDRVWDYMAQTPGIFKRTDEMQRSLPVQSLCIALEVIEYCWKTDGELADLHVQLEKSVPGPLFWPELSKIDNASDGGANGGKVFPVAYQFFNLHMATLLLSYWSLLTVVYNGMMLLYRVMDTVPVDRKAVKALGADAPPALLRGISPDCPPDCACGGDPDVPCIARFDMSTLRPLEHRADFMGPARNICQTVEYCMQPQMLDLGWYAVVAPLAVVIETIKDYPQCAKEMEWARYVLKGMKEEFPYLKNMWW